MVWDYLGCLPYRDSSAEAQDEKRIFMNEAGEAIAGVSRGPLPLVGTFLCL